ncbi:MAG: O-antigen ligase family protein [Candidatus Thiodiazotropha endolucinida]|uniref:O-antigen ligase family protein n=1 Tax=Candidatus Thiodiazotropha taylori TaxID=2792791 RepID=A0A9E4KC96_9GAMM|nr:O-antigen ligase family protein [Candidatus Thiodiazotropha sp. (ex. Lucinisca nassula)]MCG7946484.1 O-antigen ligase family protein [Candidatus Thiodiazotropha taylori]MCW4301143.1 O-antigen ligase family protein [Candidatus Thiodiazotropha endolucinida]MCG8105522.1 O-antigen ligase family protein [Candidatus Thiodiazotropha taylori]MCG8116848.1 O-antigen ligase family protein [Candidatus Thiodiazotropha taylori]
MIGTLFPLLLAFLGSALAVFNLRVGIWLSVVLLPFSATELMPRQMLGIIGLNPLNVILAATIGSLILSMAIRPASVRLPRVPVIFTVYIGLLFAGAAAGLFYIDMAPSMPVGNGAMQELTPKKYLIEELFKPLIIVVVTTLSAVIVRDDKSARKLVIAIAIALGLLGAVIIGYQLTSGINLSEMASSKSRKMLSWIGMHANDLGHLCNLGFVLMLFSFLGSKSRLTRGLFALSAVLGGTAAALSFSRSAFLGLIVVGSYLLISRRRIMDFVLALIAVAIIILLLPDAFVERATTGIESKDTYAITAGRLDGIWIPLFPEFLDSPLWGHGLSSTLWSDLNRPYFVVGHPHSAYLQILLDFGVLGAFLVAAFWYKMWSIFRTLHRYHYDPFWRAFFEGAMLAVVVILVQGLSGQRFVPWFPHTFVWLAFGVALGMHPIIMRMQKQCDRSIAIGQKAARVK